MPPAKDEILLFSGGTDSLIAWEFLKHPPVLFVNLHTKYSDTEALKVRQLAKEFDMDWYTDSRLNLEDQEASDGSGFVPHRNTFLILIASFYSNRIWLAGLGSDVVVDKNPDYAMKMSRFLTEQLTGWAKSVVVDSPFWNYTKEDTIRWLIKEKGFAAAKDMILKSFSCYSNTAKPCGKCQACFRRYVALKLHDIEEEYEVDPLEGCYNKIAFKYIPEMLKSIKGEGRYDFRRSIETLGLIYARFERCDNPLSKHKGEIQIALHTEKEKIVEQFGVEPKYTIPLWSSK